MNRLEGKVAIVTGASKGIGAGIAKALAREGASVMVNYASSKQGAEEVVEAIQKAGGKAAAVQGDVSSSPDATRIIETAVKQFGKLDVLVNNSGVYAFAPIQNLSIDSYRHHFNTNVLGPLLMTQAALQHLGQGASIINIGSGVTRFIMPNSALYSASKGAVDLASKVLAKELGPKGIRVNVLSPGVTDSEGRTSGGYANEEGDNQIISMTPLGRIGLPSDIAEVAVFLASDEAAWITGEIVYVTGGL